MSWTTNSRNRKQRKQIALINRKALHRSLYASVHTKMQVIHKLEYWSHIVWTKDLTKRKEFQSTHPSTTMWIKLTGWLMRKLDIHNAYLVSFHLSLHGVKLCVSLPGYNLWFCGWDHSNNSWTESVCGAVRLSIFRKVYRQCSSNL